MTDTNGYYVHGAYQSGQRAAAQVRNIFFLWRRSPGAAGTARGRKHPSPPRGLTHQMLESLGVATSLARP